jgi:hypothetical protein
LYAGLAIAGGLPEVVDESIPQLKSRTLSSNQKLMKGKDFISPKHKGSNSKRNKRTLGNGLNIASIVEGTGKHRKVSTGSTNGIKNCSTALTNVK